MARETFVKRQKALARQEKQRRKAARRMERREERARGAQRPEGEDPDIAGVRPGPQPKTYR
jgi:hypothetical protein